jgi:hypothetical protein
MQHLLVEFLIGENCHGPKRDVLAFVCCIEGGTVKWIMGNSSRNCHEHLDAPDYLRKLVVHRRCVARMTAVMAGKVTRVSAADELGLTAGRAFQGTCRLVTYPAYDGVSGRRSRYPNRRK